MVTCLRYWTGLWFKILGALRVGCGLVWYWIIGDHDGYDLKGLLCYASTVYSAIHETNPTQ